MTINYEIGQRYYQNLKSICETNIEWNYINYDKDVKIQICAYNDTKVIVYVTKQSDMSELATIITKSIRAINEVVKEYGISFIKM